MPDKSTEQQIIDAALAAMKAMGKDATARKDTWRWWFTIDGEEIDVRIEERREGLSWCSVASGKWQANVMIGYKSKMCPPTKTGRPNPDKMALAIVAAAERQKRDAEARKLEQAGMESATAAVRRITGKETDYRITPRNDGRINVRFDICTEQQAATLWEAAKTCGLVGGAK